MTPQQYQRLKHLFMEVIQLDETRRVAFLDDACADDPDVRREIDSLLLHHRPETIIETAEHAGQPLQQVQVQSGEPDAASAGQSVPVGAPARHEFLPGDVIADRYRIASLLGRGGMGEVYRADDLRLRQEVALKFLLRGRASDPAWLSRFHEEVRISRKVTHPNVCRVYDIGQADDHVFISMEYIDGEDMGSLLRRIGRLPRDKAIQVARQLCAGLGAAHDQGVLHRDLKPANVMIDGLGQTRITDFGIAAMVPQPGERTAIAGTPAYMAPELLLGQPPSRASDIYSLGLVLYQMVTGQRAFAADTFEQRLAEPQPPAPSRLVEGLDPVFDWVILRCMEEDPQRRPASAYAVAAALPGGDPLAAALALGHTPSPDTVAHAWGTRLHLSSAVAWFSGACVGLLVVLLLAGRTFFASNVGMGRAPAVLEDKAREAIAAIGHSAPDAQGSYRYMIEPAEPGNHPPDTAQRGPAAPLAPLLPARLVFQYHQGEHWDPPPGPLAMPTLFEVPWPVPGSRVLRLDVNGKLISYTAFPLPVAATDPTPYQPDWSVPFRLAGLRQDDFIAVPPTHLPPMYADSVAAWEPRAPSPGSRPLRVEAAAVGSQVTHFLVTEPGWTAGHPSADIPLTETARYAVFLALLAGSVVLAWRAIRSGRADRRGARRFATFMFCLQGLLWMVANRHSLHVTAEAGLIIATLRSMTFTAAATWIFYIGIEPQVRRFWPQSIISWSRLLLGHLKDPLLGRDLLVGVSAGIAVVLLRQLTVLLAHYTGWASPWLLMPDVGPDLGTLTGFPCTVQVVSQALLRGVWMGLGLMLLLLLLRLAIKNTNFATPAFIVLGAAVLTYVSYSVQSLPWLTNGLTLLVITWVLSRVGILAAIVSFFATLLLTSLPLTLDVHAWYSGWTGLVATTLGTLLAFGLYTASAPLEPQTPPT